MIPPAFLTLMSDMVYDFSKDTHQKPIEYYRYDPDLTLYKGDEQKNKYTRFNIFGLINYNYMRTWPIAFPTDTGELDRQSIQVFFNKRLLADWGLLTPENNFMYDPAMDRFIIDGLTYKPAGDTAVSQLGAIDLFYTVILKREELLTEDLNWRP